MRLQMNDSFSSLAAKQHQQQLTNRDVTADEDTAEQNDLINQSKQSFLQVYVERIRGAIIKFP